MSQYTFYALKRKKRMKNSMDMKKNDATCMT